MNAYDLEVYNFIAFILYVYLLRSDSIFCVCNRLNLSCCHDQMILYSSAAYMSFTALSADKKQDIEQPTGTLLSMQVIADICTGTPEVLF